MAVTVYRSTDASAPLLTNSNDSLIAVLRACLVDGYGSKPPAGWTAPFTGTNLIAFKQGAGGNNRYLRVYDGTNDASYGRNARFRAYENMTAISTGTGPCPTTGQLGGNGATLAYCMVGQTAPSTWVVVASASFVHVIVEQGDSNNYPEYLGFGKFVSNVPADTYSDVLIGGFSLGSGWPGYVDNTTSGGIWVMRSDTGAAGAVVSILYPEVRYSATQVTSVHGVGSSANPFPDRVLGGLLQSQALLICDGYRRGRIPGLWETHSPPADFGGHRTTWSGTGALAGRQFQIFGPIANYAFGSGAYVVIELSDTWD